MPEKSPSPIISYFVREIESSLPAADKEALGTYAEAIAGTTHHGDLRRAWHCADWAIRQAERPSNTHLEHLTKGLKEKLTLWKDTIFGADFGIMVKDGVGPGEDIEIQWVDDAVAVAKAEANASGWESVPWEELLKELLAIAPPEG
jgi:hypothetical protein